ncbi:MAG TPA: aldolase/citrate lyase family protein [Thermoleophilaceae bacterium]|nr:aldolase/citrate lyase family protein [Thermoleophilaceae bacterium]
MKLGTVITLPDVALAELTASAVDFVWIDLEHGAIDRGDVSPLAIAARAGGAECFVRLGGPHDPALGPVLDAGVDGVVVPRVEEAAEAELVVTRLRYPPRGLRGIAARRASGYGLHQLAGEPRCVVQIESEAGAAEAGRIAAVDGVEALVVGCADLAARTADVRDAVDRIHAACEAAGVEFGIAGPDDPGLLGELAPAPPDLAVLGADVRIYARALSERFEEAHVGA